MSKHVILIVEDDPTQAQLLSETVVALGHQHVHADNRASAEGLIDEGQFCMVLLDQEIKLSPDSIARHVEAGRTLITYIRKRYPGRTPAGKSLLQIIGMSGVATESDDMRRAFLDEVSDYLTKPFRKNQLEDSIRNGFRHSGRLSHDLCPAIMARATAGAQEVDGGASVARETDVVPLRITGRTEPGRNEIVLGDKSFFVTNAPFLVLLKLIVERRPGSEGWIDGSDLERNGNGPKYISKLKKQLGNAHLVENGHMGNYRLHPRVRIAHVDRARLASHSSPGVRRLSEDLGPDRKTGG
jgi:CheY-like chemotaxis protein